MTEPPPYSSPAPETLSRADLEKQAEALLAVLRISEAVNVARSLGDLFERAVDAIVRYTNFPSVALFRLDRAQSSLTLVASRGFAADAVRAAAVLPVEGSLTGIAVRQRAIVTSADLRTDERVKPAVRAALDQAGFVEVASIPLLARDDVIGALNLIYQHPAELTTTQHPILLAIGRTIGLAMSQQLEAAEQKRLQEQAFRVQQLDGLGVLAGGIAHGFNNVVAAILGNTSLAAHDLASGDVKSVQSSLAEIERECGRAKDLAARLLTFAQGGAPLRRPVGNLGSLVQDAARLITEGSGVELEFVAEEELGLVNVDPSQLRQVVQNLVLNAVQASAPRGSVRVSLERASAQAEQRSPGIRLVVEDRGEGIAVNDLPRVFEPYFTTKPGASGLGLATSYSIIKRHGGRISVSSQRGVGARFEIELPSTTAIAAAEGDHEELPLSLQGKRILIVDDEPSLRRVVARMLAGSGAIATTVAGGDEAHATFAQALAAGEPFDIVLLDLTLPQGGSGKNTLVRLAELTPAVRAVAMTGYATDAILAAPTRHGFAGGLAKPFTKEALLAALTAALPPVA